MVNKIEAEVRLDVHEEIDQGAIEGEVVVVVITRFRHRRPRGTCHLIKNKMVILSLEEVAEAVAISAESVGLQEVGEISEEDRVVVECEWWK